MTIKKHIFGLMLASACSLGATAAMAADYEPPVFEAPAEEEYVPVEVGSGWYLRGDVSYAFNDAYENVYMGNIPGERFGEDTVAVAAGLGMGYHFSDFFRVEATVASMPYNSEDYGATINPGLANEAEISAAAKNNLYAGMISAYADLGTYVGITPYIGGGIGLVSFKREANQSTNYLNPLIDDLTVTDNKRGFAVAYQIGGGLAYNVSQNVAIDVGYQYFASPDTERAVLTSPGVAHEKGIEFHQVKVGLRYDLW